MTTTLATAPCPICRATGWRHDCEAGQLLGLSPIYRVLECVACGQRKLDPQLGPVDLERLYSQGYFNSADCSNSEPPEIELPANYLDVATERHDKFRRSVSELRVLFPSAMNFLDVGAATGDMVHIARNAGLQAEGIEFSEFAVNEARKRFGLELNRMPLSEVPDELYDLIHLNHVFEHFNDPVAELRHLHRITRPGGGVYIEIPYQFHLIDRLKYRLRPVKVPFSLHSIHHPFFYSPRTIKRALRDHGFRLLQFKVFSADRYPSQTVLQKLKMALWWMLSWFQIGNYMELIAAKGDGGESVGR